MNPAPATDEQLKAEMSPMELPHIAAKPADYRLHHSPFYFKFVRRDTTGDTHHSFIVSLAHLRQLLKAADSNRGLPDECPLRSSPSALERGIEDATPNLTSKAEALDCQRL